MNNTKVYTAQEFRAAAVSPMYVGGDYVAHVRPEVYEMLEQAAEVLERCENVLKANARELKYRHKDAEIAELRRRLKVAEDALGGLLDIVCVDCKSSYEIDGKCVECPRVVAAKSALAAIRGEGGVA